MARHKILVVDDNWELHCLMKLVLGRAGYQVITAMSGKESVKQFRTQHPDLVLMDMTMPDIDGFEAIKRIRRLPQGRDVPIILLSGRSDLHPEADALCGAIDEYVTKPIKVSDLLPRIEARLRDKPPVSTSGHA